MNKFLLIVVLLSNFFWLSETKAQTVPQIIFPVIGNVTYWDDFGAPREGGARSHKGNDLMGRKMLPLVSTVDGVVRHVAYPEASWGYDVTIEDAEGYTYHYIHINNDIPGTDNGKGGGMNAYALDIQRGNRVVAGQLIGWMGDSGNAEPTQAHLHFEMRKNGELFSPYAALKAAKKITKPVDYPALPNEILPYGGFQGGATVAVGNLDADADLEIVTAAGPGGGPHIQIFDLGVQAAKSGFFAFSKTFRGGVDVATADVDGDGLGEIITVPGKGARPEVKIFKADGNQIASFLAYPAGFAGGLRVSAADLDQDGKSEIITAPASGGGAHVKIFRADGSLLNDFMAYEGFRGGIDVAVVPATSSKLGLIVTSPNVGGGPHVKVFDLAGLAVSEFLAYDEAHRGGMRVAATTTTIIAAPQNGGPDFRKFDLRGNLLDNDTDFEPWWMGSWDVAAANGTVISTVGPNSRRRTSVRKVDFSHEYLPEEEHDSNAIN